MSAEHSVETAQLPSDFIDAMRSMVGSSNFKQGSAVDTVDHGVTAGNLGAAAIVFPESSEQIAAIVKCANAHGVSIVTHGGRTGLVGGALSQPGQIIVSTARLNRIVQFSAVERVAVVDAGVTLQALQEAIVEHGLEPGIDLPSRGSATIGGMVSTNAGGISAFRYGVMRHRVLGLEAVLPDGSIYSDLTRVVKNAAGYDLKHLFIGAEGTLGIVTRVAVKLEPSPTSVATALFGLPSVEAALEATRLALAAQYGHLRAAEAIWHSFFKLTSEEHAWSASDYKADCPVNLLLSLGGADEEQLQHELGRLYEMLAGTYEDISAVLASSQAQQSQLWRLREDTDLIYRRHAAAPSFDVSVPLSEIDAYVHRCMSELRELDPGLDPYLFGHIADGNLHIVLNAASSDLSTEKSASVERIIYRDIAKIGGSFSAEHGIGSKRIHSLKMTSDPVKLALMQKIKGQLDGMKTFNPGKVTG